MRNLHLRPSRPKLDKQIVSSPGYFSIPVSAGKFCRDRAHWFAHSVRTLSTLQGENVLTRRRKFSPDHRVLDPIVLLESEPAEAVEGH
jgi:hypothetical protein